MSDDSTREAVIRAITDVAPDIDPASVRGGDSLRADLELDSMDFLSVVERLADEAGVEIPEDDYEKLTTVDACADYIASARHPAESGPITTQEVRNADA